MKKVLCLVIAVTLVYLLGCKKDEKPKDYDVVISFHTQIRKLDTISPTGDSIFRWHNIGLPPIYNYQTTDNEEFDVPEYPGHLKIHRINSRNIEFTFVDKHKVCSFDTLQVLTSVDSVVIWTPFKVVSDSCGRIKFGAGITKHIPIQ